MSNYEAKHLRQTKHGHYSPTSPFKEGTGKPLAYRCRVCNRVVPSDKCCICGKW